MHPLEEINDDRVSLVPRLLILCGSLVSTVCACLKKLAYYVACMTWYIRITCFSLALDGY